MFLLPFKIEFQKRNLARIGCATALKLLLYKPIFYDFSYISEILNQQASNWHYIWKYIQIWGLFNCCLSPDERAKSAIWNSWRWPRLCLRDLFHTWHNLIYVCTNTLRFWNYYTHRCIEQESKLKYNIFSWQVTTCQNNMGKHTRKFYWLCT